MALKSSRMSEASEFEGWQPARLIPVAGIRGEEEQEARATSACLAVLRAVPDFAYALVGDLGAPRGRIQTFSEVRLKHPEGGVSRPDGAIVVQRGGKTWKALLEVKTGRRDLRTDQTNRYLDLARDHGFDAVVTISNEITARLEDVPVTVDRRKTRKVASTTCPGGGSSPRRCCSIASEASPTLIRRGFSAS
jgi:hypothetical protein